jgi:hypothetical protein
MVNSEIDQVWRVMVGKGKGGAGGTEEICAGIIQNLFVTYGE